MFQIDGDWRIRSDSRNWILEKRVVNEETFSESWKVDGYHPSLAWALKDLAEQMLKVPDSVFKMIDKFDSIMTLIDEKCTNEVSEKFRDTAINDDPKTDEGLDFLE